MRKGAVPAALAAVAVAVVLLGGGPLHAFADALRRGLDASPAWAAAGVAFEAVSLAGYVALLSLVAGRATPRIGPRESAQITLAGAAATRLLPTAGVGGAALAVWVFRRAGLRAAAAARTLLELHGGALLPCSWPRSPSRGPCSRWGWPATTARWR